MHSELLLVLVIATALAFDFTNGFHDTANVVATSISTRAMPPRTAVAMAALLNFAGAFISLKVAATIAKDIVEPGAVTMQIVFAGLVGAIARVEIEVATTFAVSWKPLVKSNASAVAMTMTRMMSADIRRS